MKYYYIIGILILLFLGFTFYSVAEKSEKYDLKYVDGQLRSITNTFDLQETSVAYCLTNKNVILYNSKLCSHCTIQKKYFGDTYNQLNIIEVSDGNKLISDKYLEQGIIATPTWIIKGKQFKGVYTTFELAKISGCLK